MALQRIALIMVLAGAILLSASSYSRVVTVRFVDPTPSELEARTALPRGVAVTVAGSEAHRPRASGGRNASAALRAPLPRCLVGFFVHVDKTGGTSVRSLLQAQMAHGEFDAFIFTTMGKTDFWKVLVQNLAARAEAQSPVRLLVELHAGGGSQHHMWSTLLPDILALRRLFAERFAFLGADGCPVRLATMFRRPLEHALSLHHFAIHGRAPLCLWPPPSSLQLRLLLGLPYDSARLRAHLSVAHLRAAWRLVDASFDAVGTLEQWWLSMAAIIGAFGLGRPIVPTVNVAAHKGGPGNAAVTTALRCDPGHLPTVAFVGLRMNSSASTAAVVARQAWRAAGGSGTAARGAEAAGGLAERTVRCKGIGCLLPRSLLRREGDERPNDGGSTGAQAVLERAPSWDQGRSLESSGGWADAAGAAARGPEQPMQPQPGPRAAPTAAMLDEPMAVSFVDRSWQPSDCAHAAQNAQPARVLLRLCAALRHDLALYAAASKRLAAGGGSAAAGRVNGADADAAAEAARREAAAEALRVANAAPVEMSNGGASCPSCTNSRDSMLDNCWRRLVNWAPDPARFVCERHWHGGAPRVEPSRWTEEGLSTLRAPCFRTCWTARAGGARHCTAACDGDDSETDPSLAPSAQPQEERSRSLQRVLGVPPELWYERWEGALRPRLLSTLDEVARSSLLEPLDWTRLELRPGRGDGPARWPPTVWEEPLESLT